MSREEILGRIKNAKSDIEREHWQEQLQKWDGLESIYHAKYDDRVKDLRHKPKPKGKIDARSHKHAAIDASKGATGFGGSLTPLIATYSWLQGNGYIDEEALIHKVVSMVPDHVWVIVGLLGVAAWVCAYAIRLAEKREMEF